MSQASTSFLSKSEVTKTAEQLLARTSPSFNIIMRHRLDSDSDVLSIGECIKMAEATQPFDDTQENPFAATGESCFTVLHESPRPSGRFYGLRTDTSDADQTGTEENQIEVGLNSVDPYPHFRRYGLNRSLLKRYFEQNPPVELPGNHTTDAFREDQVYNLIRLACDETAHASFEMMTGLLQRASRL